MTAVTDRGPIVAAAADQPALADLQRLLQRCDGGLILRAPSGEEVALPDAAVRALQQVAGELARGRAVTVVAVHKELTTQEAAELLNVSRPYLVHLLDAGEMPYHKVGTHRRIDLDDLLAYRDRWDAARDKALRELTQLSQELGLYDSPPRPRTPTTR